MKEHIILWDNDIGWIEKLHRELARFNLKIVEFLEYETDGRLQLLPEEYEKMLLQQLARCSEEAVAMVISENQLREELDYSKKYVQGKEKKTKLIWDMLCCICECSLCPVILIADRWEEKQELAAFEAGVFDCIEREKIIQICARRIFLCTYNKKEHKKRIYGKSLLQFDKRRQMIRYAKKEIMLTPKEYQVFSILWEKKGELVSKDEFLKEVWGDNMPNCQRVVDTVIKQLRIKLRETPCSIETKYKRGYYLSDM